MLDILQLVNELIAFYCSVIISIRNSKYFMPFKNCINLCLSSCFYVFLVYFLLGWSFLVNALIIQVIQGKEERAFGEGVWYKLQSSVLLTLTDTHYKIHNTTGFHLVHVFLILKTLYSGNRPFQPVHTP